VEGNYRENQEGASCRRVIHRAGVTEWMKLPVAYQGCKSWIADQIVDILCLPSKRPFFDLCCGSGAVSLAAVEAGQPPETITMVDHSPCGLVWEAVGRGSFDLRYLTFQLNKVPEDRNKIPGYLQKLAAQPLDEHVAENFIVLQAGAAFSKPISIREHRWKTPGFRAAPSSYLRPQPQLILERMSHIVRRMRGVRGICADVRTVLPSIGDAKIYIDPPYVGKAKYCHDLPLSDLNRVCWVSEARPLSDISFKLSNGRANGGHAGTRRGPPIEEWLSLVGWVDDEP
jgi:site-specific DNA-adenine methylase